MTRRRLSPFLSWCPGQENRKGIFHFLTAMESSCLSRGPGRVTSCDIAINATCRTAALTKWTKPQEEDNNQRAHAIKTTNTSRPGGRLPRVTSLFCPGFEPSYHKQGRVQTVTDLSGGSCHLLQILPPLTPIDSLLHSGSTDSWDEVIGQKPTDRSTLIFIGVSRCCS